MLDFLKKKKKPKDKNLSKLPELPRLPDLPSIPNKKVIPKSKPRLPSLDIPDIKVSPFRKSEPIPRKMPIEIQPEKEKMFAKILKKPIASFSKAKKYEQESIKKEQEELNKLHDHEVTKPIFIEGSLFKQILVDVSSINTELKEGNDSLEKVKTIEKRKSTKFGSFKSSVLNVQRKLIFVDKLLFK